MLPPVLAVTKGGQLGAQTSEELLTWSRNEVLRQPTGEMKHALRDMEELWEVRLGKGSLVFHLGRGLGGLRKSPRMSRYLKESGHCRQENHLSWPRSWDTQGGLERKEVRILEGALS